MLKQTQSILIIPALLIATTLSACSPAEEVTPKSPFHGIHGLGFDQQGRLLAGSVLGSRIYVINTQTGASDEFIKPPLGQSDDIAFGPNNTIAWTAFLQGKIYLRDGEGKISTIAENLPGINSIDFAPNGKLYATQVFLADALYEIDPKGVKPPRKLMENMGGLNGFEIGDDGKLYGPLWFKGKIVQVNLEKAELKTIADGFTTPAAVNFDPITKELYAVDTTRGEIIKINQKTGKKTLIAKVKPSIDNLAFNKNGQLFISNMADNAIIQINKTTGETTTITSGKLATAGDIAITEENGQEIIYVADVFALRKVNTQTGEVQTIARMFAPTPPLEYPIHIHLTQKYILVTGWSSGTVQVFDRKINKSLALLHSFTTPHDITMLPNGDILVAEFTTGKILRLNGKGWKNKQTFATNLVGPANLLLSNDNKTLYILENLAGRLIALDLPSLKRKLIIQGLQGAEGLAHLNDGRLLIAETKKQQLIAVSPNGNKEIILNDAPINGLPAQEGPSPPTNLPTGLAVGKDGTIYFSSDEFANIWKIPPQAGNSGGY